MQKRIKIEETRDITSKSTKELVENYVKLHSKIKKLQEELKVQAQEVLGLFDNPRYKDSNFIVGNKVVCKVEGHSQVKVNSGKLFNDYPEIYERVIERYNVSACVQVRALKK